MPSVKYEVSQDVVVTKLDGGESVLLDLTTGHYYSLNETGTRVWELISTGSPESEIAESLTREYDVSREEASQHVEAVVTKLKSKGLVSQMKKRE